MDYQVRAPRSLGNITVWTKFKPIQILPRYCSLDQSDGCIHRHCHLWSCAACLAQKGNNEVSAKGNMKEKLWTFDNEGCLTDISLQGMLHRCSQIQATSCLRGCFFITAHWDQGIPQEYWSGQPIGNSSQLWGGSGATEEKNDACKSGNLVASTNQYVEPSWKTNMKSLGKIRPQ